MNAEPFAVIKRVVDGMDLQFAAVARTRIDLPYGKTSPEMLADGLFKLCAYLNYFLFSSRWKWFGYDAGPENLTKNS